MIFHSPIWTASCVSYRVEQFLKFDIVFFLSQWCYSTGPYFITFSMSVSIKVSLKLVKHRHIVIHWETLYSRTVWFEKHNNNNKNQTLILFKCRWNFVFSYWRSFVHTVATWLNCFNNKRRSNSHGNVVFFCLFSVPISEVSFRVMNGFSLRIVSGIGLPRFECIYQDDGQLVLGRWDSHDSSSLLYLLILSLSLAPPLPLPLASSSSIYLLPCFTISI